MLAPIYPTESDSNPSRRLPPCADSLRFRRPSVGSFTSPAESQFLGASAADSDWAGGAALRRSPIRRAPRWRYSLTHRILWGEARPYVAVAAGLMALALMFVGVDLLAAAFAVGPVPGDMRGSPLASNILPPPQNATPAKGAPAPAAPDSPVMRAAKTAPVENVVGSAADAFFPFPMTEGRVTFEAVERTPQVSQAPSEDDSASRRPAPPARQVASLEQPLTKLVAFDSAPFPYDGMQPTGAPFLDVVRGGQRGHRTFRGEVLWEDKTFNDPRVLLHIPAGFDPDHPAVMVVFFHGYGSTLSRDVLVRQQLPAQISASGANAVLVAPQFAVDARDSSAGRFWEPGAFSRFLDETAKRLARLRGDPASEQTFAKMPVVLVAYSGGFLPAALCLKDAGAADRVRGVVLLDAAYGELDTFANWIAAHRSAFLVSAYTHFTQPRNAELEHILAERGVAYTTAMHGNLSRGGATFLFAEAPHQDYVTQAWTEDPVKDILLKLPEFRLREPQSVAAMASKIRLANATSTKPFNEATLGH